MSWFATVVLICRFRAGRTFCAILAGVLLASSSVAGAADAAGRDPYAAILSDQLIEPTLEGVTTYFGSLVDNEQQVRRRAERVAELIRQLGDDDWRRREQATLLLIRMTPVPRAALEEAVKSDDAEVVWRAQRVLAESNKQIDVQVQRAVVTDAVLRTIEHKPIKGAAEAVLSVVATIKRPYVLDAARDALAATCAPDDAELLRRAIKGDNVNVKAVAIVALGRAVGGKAVAELRSLLTDGDEKIRLAAAHALADQGDRTALPALVKLLSDDDVHVRLGAVNILRTVSGERFDFSAFAGSQARKEAAEKWRQWIGKHAHTAKMRFPFKLEMDDFASFCRSLKIISDTGGGSAHFVVMLNGKLLAAHTGARVKSNRGITVIGIYKGEIVLGQAFDTWGKGNAADAFANAVAKLPTGCFVVMGIMDEGTRQFNPRGQDAIELVGGKIKLYRAPNYSAYYCIGYKGLIRGYALDAISGGGARGVRRVEYPPKKSD